MTGDMKPGEQLVAYAEETKKQLGKGGITIVETGCLRRDTPEGERDDGWSTLHFAKWAEANGSQFFSVDDNREHIQTAGTVLARYGIKPEFPMFTYGESVSFLSGFGGSIDLAYLDSCDGWDHGLAEFKAAEAKGAQIIVMDDYVGKVVSAASYAKREGWDVQQEGRFTVMRRK